MVVGGSSSWWRLSLCIAAMAALVAACGSSNSRNTADYYVSLGDSYATGVQPDINGNGQPTTNGFAYQVVGLAVAKGYHFTLANFGCGGATTTSIDYTVGCAPGSLGVHGIAYPTTTQALAAEAFIHAHSGHIGLITVSIGGNDVEDCSSSADPNTCLVTTITSVKTNLSTLLAGLRAAAGPEVPIVGTTYPDVLLGQWVHSDQATAMTSLTTFKSLLNPALLAAYHRVRGKFVDVTAATGAYIPLDQTTTLAPYGAIPQAVANVCELTYYCLFQDVHPKTPGYTRIAQLVVRTLPEQ